MPEPYKPAIYGNRRAEVLMPTNQPNTLVLLDRDGVLFKNLDHGVTSPDKVILVPGLVEALARLQNPRFHIAIFTNQHYLANGELGIDDFNRMSELLRENALKSGIASDRFTVTVCPHLEDAGCACRKPNPGLIEQAVEAFKLIPRETRFVVVGDKMADSLTLELYYERTLAPLGVTRNQLTTILLNWEYGERRDNFRLGVGDHKPPTIDYEADNLHQALEIVKREEQRHISLLRG